MDSVCTFCGSSEGACPAYVGTAREMGAEAARRGLTLVYGGERVDLMGALADAALREGGEVVGVMPEALVDREISHKGLAKLHVVGTMHDRKMLMNDLSDGFVALPGGYGTLEEFSQAMAAVSSTSASSPRASSARTIAPSSSPKAIPAGSSTRWGGTRRWERRSGSTRRSYKDARR